MLPSQRIHEILFDIGDQYIPSISTDELGRKGYNPRDIQKLLHSHALTEAVIKYLDEEFLNQSK